MNPGSCTELGFGVLFIFNPRSVTANFSKLLEQNGLRHIRFHDLSHSYASLLLANDVPLKQIQEWLGHSDIGTTANIYNHLDYKSKITSANVRVATADRYRLMIEQYTIPRIGSIKLTKLTAHDLQKLYEELMESGRTNRKSGHGNPGLSSTTVRSLYLMLHNALNRAVKERLILRNPTEDCIAPKIRDTDPPTGAYQDLPRHRR